MMANRMNQIVHFSTQYCTYNGLSHARRIETHRIDTFSCFFRWYRAALDCSENDYLALLGLCLVYSLANNKGNCPIHIRSTNANSIIRFPPLRSQLISFCNISCLYMFLSVYLCLHPTPPLSLSLCQNKNKIH